VLICMYILLSRRGLGSSFISGIREKKIAVPKVEDWLEFPRGPSRFSKI